MTLYTFDDRDWRIECTSILVRLHESASPIKMPSVSTIRIVLQVVYNWKSLTPHRTFYMLLAMEYFASLYGWWIYYLASEGQKSQIYVYSVLFVRQDKEVSAARHYAMTFTLQLFYRVHTNYIIARKNNYLEIFLYVGWSYVALWSTVLWCIPWSIWLFVGPRLFGSDIFSCQLRSPTGCSSWARRVS